MLRIVRTDSTHKDFKDLVQLLDADLAIRDGDDHDFYHQFNSIDALKEVVVIYDDQTLVGCGAIKFFDKQSVEVKRMFTLPEARGKGVASRTLRELEAWAKELGYKKCVLETGVNQPEAIALYRKRGYMQTPNYGQYKEMEASLCFEKIL